MRNGFKVRLAAIVAVGTVALVPAAAAGAGQVFHETIHDEDTVVLDDFCDVPGLSVELSLVLDMRVHAVPHGPDGLVFFLQHGTETDVFTNLANGKSVTGVSNVIEKDKQITVNGDGTLTILILATGNAVVYGANGKAIARNPGQLRFEILVDENGTPNDPSDDVVTRLGVVKGSTGRSDDFCGAVVPALS